MFVPNSFSSITQNKQRTMIKQVGYWAYQPDKPWLKAINLLVSAFSQLENGESGYLPQRVVVKKK